MAAGGRYREWSPSYLGTDVYAPATRGTSRAKAIVLGAIVVTVAAVVSAFLPPLRLVAEPQILAATTVTASSAPTEVTTATGTSSFTVSPASALPGASATARGSGFPKGRGQLLWDGSAAGMPSFQVDGKGGFSTTFTVPKTAKAGTHTVALVSTGTGSKAGAPGPQLASVVFSVVLAVATPTATSGSSPTAAPTPTPGVTTAPTSTPVATVTPAATLAPSPTVAPSATVVPTPAPAPSATPVATPAPTVTPNPLPTATPVAAPFVFGTLESDPARAVEEYAAGVRMVHMGIPWSAYEPQDGVFSSGELAYQRQKLAAFKAAGMKISLGLGLHHPPSWIFSYPNSRYVDQYGVADGTLPNLAFNTTVRAKAEEFIRRALSDLGASNFWAIRIQAGKDGEVLYPSETDSAGHGNSYWAFDAAAQATSPFPGWKPGDKTLTTSQVGQWYDWYLGAMADNVNWQIALYRRLGFGGYLQVLMPGPGVRPNAYNTAIANWLNGTGDSNHTMGVAAVWNRLLDKLADRRGVVASITSLADGSGNDDVCQSSDANVAITDPIINTWSAARWISYNANRYGMAKNGENPSRSDSTYAPYGRTMMDKAAAQMDACGLQGMQWAHDFNLYDGVSGITLDDYAAEIAAYQ